MSDPTASSFWQTQMTFVRSW